MFNCDFTVSNLYEHLQQCCDICIVGADEYLSPAPVARLERHSYEFESKKLEFCISVGHGDCFSYQVRL